MILNSYYNQDIKKMIELSEFIKYHLQNKFIINDVLDAMGNF